MRTPPITCLNEGLRKLKTNRMMTSLKRIKILKNLMSLLDWRKRKRSQRFKIEKNLRMKNWMSRRIINKNLLLHSKTTRTQIEMTKQLKTEMTLNLINLVT